MHSEARPKPAPLAQLPEHRLIELYYHVTDLPNGVTTTGIWDLRTGVDDYLGRVDFRGKRVLEIGPASGYLTMEMEHRGADVTALELPDEIGWDFVPFPSDVVAGIREERQITLAVLKQTFALTRRLFQTPCGGRICAPVTDPGRAWNVRHCGLGRGAAPYPQPARHPDRVRQSALTRSSSPSCTILR